MNPLTTRIRLDKWLEAGMEIKRGQELSLGGSQQFFQVYNDLSQSWYDSVCKNDPEQEISVMCVRSTISRYDQYNPYTFRIKNLFYHAEVFPAEPVRTALSELHHTTLMNVVNHGIGDKKLVGKPAWDNHTVLTYAQGFIDGQNPKVRPQLREFVTEFLFDQITPQHRTKIISALLERERREILIRDAAPGMAA